MSELEPGLYPVTWRRHSGILSTPDWWPPVVLEWSGAAWRFVGGRECPSKNAPDWIGPKLDLPEVP